MTDETRDTNQESPITNHGDEPAWIRDVSAANFGVQIKSTADIAALCEGQKTFCELCGMEFPLWPPKLWAGHYTDKHHAEVTVQGSAAVGMFCTDELTPSIQQWVHLQVISRTAIRRRARDLNLIVWPKEPSRLVS